MANFPHLRIRAKSLVFRRRVPADLRGRIGCCEIVRSLKTGAPVVARRRSRLLWAATEKMFEAVREEPSITPAAVERLMALVAAKCAWADDVHVARTGRYFTVDGPAPADVDAILFETEANEFRDALARNDIAPVRDQVVDYAGRLGLAVAPGSLDERIIGRAVLRAFADQSERAADRVRTEISRTTGACDGLAAIGPDSGERDIASRVSDEAAFQPTSNTSAPARFAGLTIQSLWPTFAEDRVSSTKWKRKIANQSYGTMRAWVKAIGDTPPEAITSAPAIKFQRIMRRLPGNYAKCSAWRDLSFTEITAQVADTVYKPLAITTWNRHVSVMSAFWDWAVRNELTFGAKDPFEGLWIDADDDLDVMEGGSEDRSMWSEEQLRVLLNSPLFRGCQSPYRRHKPGSFIIRDPLYWVVLIAAFSGMRREEIFQLSVRHVVKDQETGIIYFDLKAPGLVLKNKDSRRWVPLHRHLLELGFLTERVDGRAPDDRIFPELQGKDNFGDKLGKQFTRYRKNLGVYERLLDLHSFRHTVSTLLMRVGVPQAHAEELTGHRSDARRTAFAIYDKGATLRILNDIINQVFLPIDTHQVI